MKNSGKYYLQQIEKRNEIFQIQKQLEEQLAQKKQKLDSAGELAEGMKNAQDAINSRQNARNKMNHGFGHVIDDFFAPAEDLLSLDT